VFHDFLGIGSQYMPKFVKRYAQLGDEITSAAKAFAREVASGEYPDPEHTYG
jgi:3-methyl-2-oxobutanoate hydroxymethyltransferase